MNEETKKNFEQWKLELEARAAQVSPKVEPALALLALVGGLLYVLRS